MLEADGVGVFADWHLYALTAVGFSGMSLTQMALGTGVLPPAVATSSILNPASSVLLGIVLFEESIHRSALDSTLAVLALLAMFGGIAVLALGQRDGGGGWSEGPEIGWAQPHHGPTGGPQ